MRRNPIYRKGPKIAMETNVVLFLTEKCHNTLQPLPSIFFLLIFPPPCFIMKRNAVKVNKLFITVPTLSCALFTHTGSMTPTTRNLIIKPN